MVENEDISKIQSFILHLLSSPKMKQENILIAENMIYSFIAQNKQQLLTMFKTPQYFPHLEPAEVISSLISELNILVRTQALESINEFFESTDFEVLNKFPDAPKFPAQYQRETLKKFMTDFLFANREIRANFSAVYNIFQYGIIDKYVTHIFKRRDFLYNELVRVQKTYLEVDEYIVFLKVLLLVRSIAHVKVNISEGDSTVKNNLADVMKMPGKINAYISALSKEMKPWLPNLSDRVLTLAIKSNLNETFTGLDEASSRFLYIMSTRFNNYKHIAKLDRGAESPDKSWFAIARKNAKLFGFEKNMLEDLYRISGDNNW